MRNLFENLNFLKSKSYIQFIDSASIPVIKLQMGLPKVHKQMLMRDGQGMKQELQVHKSMEQLGVDVTFEENASQAYYGNESQGGLNQNLGI